MKTVLMLGSTSDIAKAIIHTYIKEGYGIHLAAKDKDKLIDQKKRLEKEFPGTKIQSTIFDISNYDKHRTFYDTLSPKPYGVITAIGYLGNSSYNNNTFEETKKIIDINYLGNISIFNIIANDFEKRGSGFMIGISSIAGERGKKSNYIYGSAKAGFSTYLSGLRNRLSSKNIQVITVHPGYVKTQMTAHLTLPKLLTATPKVVARDILNAQKNGKDIIYSLWIWRYIMIIIKILPEKLFKRLSL